MTALVAFALLLAAFAGLLTYPFSRPNLRILVLSPAPIGESTIKSPQQIDLSSLCARANASQVTAAVKKQDRSILVPFSDRSFATNVSTVESQLRSSVTSQSTLVVYVSGVLSLGVDPGLTETSHEAQHSGNTMNIVGLVRMLQHLRCKRVLLCVDATTPFDQGRVPIATSASWTNLRMQIEKQLIATDATPIAALLNVKAIDIAPSQDTLSPMAKRLSLVFERDSLDRAMTLSELQKQIGAKGETEKEDASRNQSMWLVSANWPLETDVKNIPIASSKSAFEKNSVDTSNANKDGSIESPFTSTESTAAFPLSGSIDELDRWLDTADVTEMLQLCEDILYAWTQSPNVADCPSLLLPKPWSRKHTAPFVFFALQDACRKLTHASMLSPQAIDRDEVGELVRAMVLIDRQLPLPASAPQWLRGLQSTLPTPLMQTSPSLVVNAVYSAVGLLRDPAMESNLKLLVDLINQLEVANAPTQILSYIERIDGSAKQSTEIAFIQSILASDELTWHQQLALIRIKLLATRVACDPVCDDETRTEIKLGDTARLEAERSRIDRSRVDWKSYMERKAQHAFTYYRRAIERIEAKRLAQMGYDAMIDQKYFQLASQMNAHRSASIQEHSQTASFLDEFTTDWCATVSPWHVSMAEQWKSISRAAMADLKQAKDSSEKELRLLNDYEQRARIQTEALMQWLGTNRDAIPRGSFFWSFVMRHWHGPMERLSDLVASVGSSTPAILRSNIDRLVQEMYGATDEEAVEIERQLSWWLAAYSPIQPHSVGLEKSTLTLRGEARLNLSVNRLSTTNVALRSQSNEPQETKIAAVYDSDAYDLSLDGNPVESNMPLTIPPTVDLQQGVQIPFSVRRLNGKSTAQPIVLVATRGSDQRRLVVPIESNKEPMVSMRVVQPNVHLPQGSTNSFGSNQVLFANQTSELAISLENLAATSATYNCRILMISQKDADPPRGAIALTDGMRWLDQVGRATVLATAFPVELGIGESKSLLFVPAPIQAHSSCPSIDRLVLEIREESGKDETGKKVQFETWTPHVIPPQWYARCEVLFDAERQAIDVSLNVKEERGISTQGTEINVDLLEPSTLEKIATSTIRLGKGLRGSSTSLSTSRCRTHRALLVVTVDGWKSTYVYDLDLSRSGTYEPSRQLHGMRLLRSTNTPVVSIDKSHVEVQLECMLSDDGFDENRDTIMVGLDRNNNRILQDDIVVTLKQTRHVRFDWQGVGVNGLPALRSIVEDYRVKLPIEDEWTHWVAAMAVLQQGDKSHYSHSIPIVLDRVPPKIETFRILGKQPCLLSAPLSIEIKVDDAGLSGVALVEGAWSTTGELEIKESEKTTPAIYRDADRWLLTIPTIGMPSGKSSILIRATDRAGNVAKTHAVTVDLRTEEERLAWAASIKTQIRGQVKYGSIPLAGVTMKLVPIQEVTKGTPDKTVPMVEPIATAVTLSTGRFILDQVPSGNYGLEVSGIVRGMRQKRTQEIVVDAQGPPLEILIQLDKKP